LTGLTGARLRESDETHRSPGPAHEIEAEFRLFRDQAAQFVARIAERLPLRGQEDPDANARENLEITRTVFSKWSTDILVALFSLGGVGFEELRRSLRGVSPRVLSLKLKGLESLGLVARNVLNVRPPRVEYRLTESGLTVARLGEPVLLFLRFRKQTRD
jgi:DNA-binding HxlR family transcriptional regulator